MCWAPCLVLGHKDEQGSPRQPKRVKTLEDKVWGVTNKHTHTQIPHRNETKV